MWLTVMLGGLILLPFSLGAAPDSLYSAMDKDAISEVTGEELLALQSDFFPLSLAGRGRQSAVAWRGMPPGFLDDFFGGMRLRHPLWGYWDAQLLPLEIIRSRQADASRHLYRIRPVRVPFSQKPLSRIAYAQDYGFGLSYLDAGLQEYYGRNSYFRLGGGNFLRSGQAPEYTASQINSYRAQIHHRFSPKVSTDTWYWQMRHRYRLGQWPFFGLTEQVRRVGQLFWSDVTYRPDSLRTLVLTPYLQKWGDHFWNQTYSEQFKSEIISPGLKGRYRQQTARGSLYLGAVVDYNGILESLNLRKAGQWRGAMRADWQKTGGRLGWEIGAGFYYYQDVGSAPALNLAGSARLTRHWKITARAGETPANLPLVALYANGDSLQPLVSPRVPRRRSLSADLQFSAGNRLVIRVTPFYHAYLNYPEYQPPSGRFAQHNVDSYGAAAEMEWRLWRFTLRERATFDANFRTNYSPQFNNVLRLRLPLALFHRALKLESFAVYRFIGRWYVPQFHPLVNQYVRSTTEAGNYHLLDFKLLAHIKSATLFFTWQNTLSQDYAIVSGYWEFYRTFRMGIYWTLFN